MSQVIELTVRNWDEVYEDLSKRLKVKPKAGVELSKHLKMAGKLSSPLLAQIFRGLYFQECSQKWKPPLKKGKGRRLKTYIRCPRFSLRLLTQVLECFKKNDFHWRHSSVYIKGRWAKGGEDERGNAEECSLNQRGRSALLKIPYCLDICDMETN